MRIWVDCTAAAHPLVMKPIVERLEGRGHEIFITTRDYGQTLGVLDRLGMPYEPVCSHGGASSLRKATMLAGRSTALLGPIRRWRPDLALAHGSVDLAFVSALHRIPAVQMQDYEYAHRQRAIAFLPARRVLMPESIPVKRLRWIGVRRSRLFRFPGLKEDYYLAGFKPAPAILDELRLDREKVLVVLRPPPENSEYHVPNELYGRTIRYLAGRDEVQAVVIPRTDEQGAEVRALAAANLVVPARAIDAQSLIAFADLVVSAGGTMNREAVALGTPVYTTFASRMGGVDEALIREGRLCKLVDPSELPLRKRGAPARVVNPRDPDLLVDAILGAVETVE